jgi:hypothetical protein
MSRLVPVRVPTPEREGIVQRPDWRLERMASIVEGLDLGEEWDAERQLIIPGPDGRLTGKARCSVADCPRLRHSAQLLCDSHLTQFERSDADSLDAWLGAGPHLLGVCLPLEHCIVEGCSSPGVTSGSYRNDVVQVAAFVHSVPFLCQVERKVVLPITVLADCS